MLILNLLILHHNCLWNLSNLPLSFFLMFLGIPQGSLGTQLVILYQSITQWEKLLDFDCWKDCEFICNLRANSVIRGKLQISRANL